MDRLLGSAQIGGSGVGARTRGQARRGWLIELGAMAGLLVVVNLISVADWHRSTIVVVQVTAAVGAVAGARWRGYSPQELGLAVDRTRSGLACGAIAAAVVAVGVAFVAVLPPTRQSFADDRFRGLSIEEVAFEAGLRIPLITALSEELLFRSVLLAILWRRVSTMRAVVASSLLFGAWHVVTISGAGVGDLGLLANGIVVVGVTTLAGVVFCLLRIRSGSVVSAWLVHATLNATAYLAGAVITAR